MPLFADIALPVSVDTIFTYSIPRELLPSARIGVRAIVPFGRLHATGLIVGLPESTPIRSLKPLHDIIDAAPVASDELLRLCRWIAAYYLSPLGEVLKAAMPHAFSSSSKRLVRLGRPVTPDELQGLKSRSPRRATLLALLTEKGPLPSTELQRRTGLKNINVVLNDLVHDGILETEDILPRTSARPAIREFIELSASDLSRLASAIESTPPRKTRTRRLLQTIHDLRAAGVKEIASMDLLKQAAAHSMLLREFAAEGLIAVTRREVHPRQDFGTDDTTLTHVLNESQRTALAAITDALDAGVNRTFLLHGVTGSGKTQVYIQAIRHCVDHGKTAIVLVPEIALTPQIVRRFRSHFGDRVAVVHSRMSAGERRAVWRRALAGDCTIVIGPRSAVFAPLRDTTLIIVDEEHEASYKQFDSNPRYNARDVAVVRGTLQNAVVVLGSATPSSESAYNAREGKYALLSMPHRIDQVPMPPISIVDMTAERKREYASLKAALPEERRAELKQFRQSPISLVLREKIRDRLDRREGIILLQNRRGFAPFVECPDCGYTETCDNCSVTMTYHLASRHLRCHYCGSVRVPHSACPQCQGVHLQLIGVGTQRVEQEIEALFPEARVLRMDLDTTSRKGAHDRILRTFGNGDADILLGTQMVAKGLDFPRVTLVGVISADTQMLLPDFRSSERTYQLLTQVAGRAGRSTLRGEVIIQTHQPDHHTLHHVVAHDYWQFFEEELAFRQELDYPPFSRLVLVEVRGPDEGKVSRAADRFAGLLPRADGSLRTLGPAPAVISRIKKAYRWHILIKSLKREDTSASRLHRVLVDAVHRFGQRTADETRLIIDVDPVGIL